MDYLTDGAPFVFNGSKQRMGVAVDNGHIIAFPRKGQFWDDLATSAAVLAGVAVPVVAVPAALVALGFDKALRQSQRESLSVAIEKLKKKFKLGDEDMLISNNENSSVILSGNSFLTIGNTKVDISGRFVSGDKTVEAQFGCAFNSGKSGLQRLFERNGYKVQII